MPGPTDREGAWATATLRRSLQLVRTREGRLIAASAAGLYLFAALLVGKMLVFGPTGQTGISTVYLPSGQPEWLFPMYIVLAPNAVLELPLYSVAAMVLVSAGIGIGMGVAGVLGLRLLRWRRRRLASPTALGSVAGLTPAMIALLTLGACCSTTAAATAGIGVVANATGTSTDNLLVNTWFLTIFQLAVLWVALVAQERLIVVYSALFDPERATESPSAAVRFERRTVVVGLARILLLAGAVTWSLSMLADWTTLAPGSASAGQWLDWILIVQLPAVTAGALALAPDAILRAGRRLAGAPALVLARLVLLAGGLLLLVGVPAPLASPAFHGLGNEVLAVLGYPLGAGGVPVPGIDALALAARWGLQMIPLGLATAFLGIAPARTVRALVLAPVITPGATLRPVPDPERAGAAADWSAPPPAPEKA